MSKQMISSFTRVLLGGCMGATLIAMSSLSAQAEGDCGRGWWRGPEGHCHPDRERVVVEPVVPLVPPVVVETPVKVCPIAMHWSPRRHECVLN